MKKYVISHKTTDQKDLVTAYADKLDLYLKEICFGKYLWGDIMDATKFNTLEEAQNLVRWLPYKHVIVEIEVNETANEGKSVFVGLKNLLTEYKPKDYYYACRREELLKHIDQIIAEAESKK